MTRVGLLGTAALSLAFGLVRVLVDDHDPDLPQPLAPASVQEQAYQGETVTDDLAAWDVTGAGTLTSAVEGDETVWTATGRGRATWTQPLAGLVFDLGFQFPEKRVDAGVVVRVPGNELNAGVEVELDRAADGGARVGYISGLVDPIVYIQPPPSEWHTLRVTVSGERVIVHVDGQHVVDWVDLAPGDGRMAAQGKVALRFSDGIRFKSVKLAETSELD